MVHIGLHMTPQQALSVCMIIRLMFVCDAMLRFVACAGQLLAMKISQRTVAVSGGMLFLLFAAHNLVYGGHD